MQIKISFLFILCNIEMSEEEARNDDVLNIKIYRVILLERT